MKQQLSLLALIVAGSLAIHTASAQTHVEVGVNEQNYPGYSHYSYPRWHGHYHDKAYYDHYHDRFYREHKTYFAQDGHFDHDRWNREHHRDHDRNRDHDHHR